MAGQRVVLSGIQPSGDLMLGNYIGALKRWVELQNDFQCYFMMVDLHALTVPQDAIELRRRCLDGIALYVAAGLDPDRSVLFVQSHVPAHAQLAWILTCVTHMGELNKMTQYKEKGRRHDAIGVGLFAYPVLMAADVLLYQTHLVPVGDDQRQHLELTRVLAGRFNHLFGPTFRVPEALIGEAGSRIMSLQNPLVKMSKSDANRNAFIALLDPPDAIRAKIMRAVTDSGSEIRPGELGPAVRNLLTIGATISERSLDDYAQGFAGRGYGTLKEHVVELLVAELAPIQARYARLRDDDAALLTMARAGAARARAVAAPTLRLASERVGFTLSSD